MYTVDTSVWVNSFDHADQGTRSAAKYCNTWLGKECQSSCPIWYWSRSQAQLAALNGLTQAQAFATALSQLPNVTFIALDEPLAMQALILAAQHSLRGADAVFAAVALQEACLLISLDNEHLTRLKSVVTVWTPGDALSNLALPPET